MPRNAWTPLVALTLVLYCMHSALGQGAPEPPYEVNAEKEAFTEFQRSSLHHSVPVQSGFVSTRVACKTAFYNAFSQGFTACKAQSPLSAGDVVPSAGDAVPSAGDVVPSTPQSACNRAKCDDALCDPKERLNCKTGCWSRTLDDCFAKGGRADHDNPGPTFITGPESDQRLEGWRKKLNRYGSKEENYLKNNKTLLDAFWRSSGVDHGIYPPHNSSCTEEEFEEASSPGDTRFVVGHVKCGTKTCELTKKQCIPFWFPSVLKSNSWCYPSIKERLKNLSIPSVCVKGGVFGLRRTDDFHHEESCHLRKVPAWYEGPSPKQKELDKCAASQDAMRGFYGRTGVVVYKRTLCTGSSCVVHKSAKCFTCRNRIFEASPAWIPDAQREIFAVAPVRMKFIEEKRSEVLQLCVNEVGEDRWQWKRGLSTAAKEAWWRANQVYYPPKGSKTKPIAGYSDEMRCADPLPCGWTRRPKQASSVDPSWQAAVKPKHEPYMVGTKCIEYGRGAILRSRTCRIAAKALKAKFARTERKNSKPYGCYRTEKGALFFNSQRRSKRAFSTKQAMVCEFANCTGVTAPSVPVPEMEAWELKEARRLDPTVPKDKLELDMITKTAEDVIAGF